MLLHGKFTGCNTIPLLLIRHNMPYQYGIFCSLIPNKKQISTSSAKKCSHQQNNAISTTQALKKTFYLKVFPKITLHIRRLTLWLHSCYDVKKNQPNRDDKKKKCHVSPAQSSTGQSDVNQVNK